MDVVSIVSKDIKLCGCCGEPRPYPQSPGLWEFKENPTHPTCEWRKARIQLSKEEPGELEIIPLDDPKGEPIWWPNNAKWRKVEEPA